MGHLQVDLDEKYSDGNGQALLNESCQDSNARMSHASFVVFFFCFSEN
jgi:hypothetical protein